MWKFVNGYFLLALAAAAGQTAAPRAFEAATIKPTSEVDGHSGWHSHTGNLTMQGQTLKSAVAIAYHIQNDQVSGGPKWADSDRYDIVAKAAGPAKDPELLEMLQTLLAERFQLKMHHETKAFPGYVLVVAKNGLKISPVAATGSSNSHSTRTKLEAQGISTTGLAETLTRILHFPVVDKTGVAGVFNIKLEWAPDDPSSGDAPSGPSLFTALQDLGLKLESRKVERPMIVIDGAEKPSAN